jgi:hypothetical protein
MDEQEKRKRLFRRRQKHGNMPVVAAAVAHRIGSRTNRNTPRRGLARVTGRGRLAGLR